MVDANAYYQAEYLQEYHKQLDVEAIQEQRSERAKLLVEKKVERFRDAVEACPELPARKVDLASHCVQLGEEGELDAEQHSALKLALKEFLPWKKGPFDIYGNAIDAEWRSDLKWQRILPHKHSLEGKRVADIGCNNGYYLYRMASENPELVVGFEPYARHYYNFALLQSIARTPRLAFELLGVEQIDLYRGFFDSVFCLGILYHHTDPVSILRKIHRCLKPGGELIVDCQGIVGDDPVALVPSGRYATARAIWYLPTLSALKNWLHRANFQELDCFYAGALDSSEQRTTEWAPIQSLKDFLDPNDSSKTIEGYPAPWRFYIRAVRKL